MKKFNTIACALFVLASSVQIMAAPIHDAALQGDVNALQEALKTCKNVNVKDRYYRHTPLHCAVQYGHCDAMRFLLVHNADVNAKEGLCDHTPLHFAVRYGHCDAIQLLLKYGANVNAKDVDGRTPLHEAAQYNRYEAMKILLDYGADANAKNKNGLTALMIAARYGHKECVEILKYELANFQRLQEFIQGGGLSMMVALMRDFAIPVEGNLYEGGVPQAWWKMPFEMSSFVGVSGLEVPKLRDVGEKDWGEKGWGPDAVWCQ